MRSGIVTIAGRPNVGKSSLLNALVGRKVSIVSHKPQTTRHRIQGVLHHGDDQIVFVDTPGLHLLQKRALNRAMNDAAAGALYDVDLVLFVVEAGRWTEEDQAVFDRLGRNDVPVALILNKVDRITDREALLPELQRLTAMRDYVFVVPASAVKRDNLHALRDEILRQLPEGPPLYPQGQVVAHGDDFTVAEVIREKLIRNLHQELPYALTVEIEHYEREEGIDRISAIIWVERDGQKKIVIGDGGETLKKVGSGARRELERLMDRKVFLKLWCKVRENWSDDPKALRRFGLSGDD